MNQPLLPGYYLARPMPLIVMAVADGWVMAHYEGCTPFCEQEEKFRKRLEMGNEKPKPSI